VFDTLVNEYHTSTSMYSIIMLFNDNMDLECFPVTIMIYERVSLGLSCNRKINVEV
jgi:hypothetical protein